METLMDLSKAKMPEGHTRVQWAIAVLVSTTFFTYGLQCGWVSPMTKILKSQESPAGRPLTDTEISLIAGHAFFVCYAWYFNFGFYCRQIWKKMCHIFYNWMSIIFLQISWVIKICPANAASLITARFIAGLAAGGCFTVVSMYVKEISQDNIRGTLGSMMILAQNLGILAMYALGGYLDYHTVLYLVVGLPIITIIFFIKAPESPAFLIKQGKLDEAASNISLLRGLDAKHKQVQAEIDIIKKEDDYFNSIPNISFFNIFKDKAWRRGFLLMMVIVTINGLNGAFCIITYASLILADSEAKISAEMQTLGLPVFLTIGTVITMACVDRFGRKLLLGTTFAISVLTFSTLALTILLRNHGWTIPGWLPITTMLLTVCCYGAGIAPIPMIIMSEMFNFQIRAKLMACLCTLSWLSSFVQLTLFTAATNLFGAHVPFFIFAAMNLLGAVVVIVLLPETRRKTVEQIERELVKEKILVKGLD